MADLGGVTRQGKKGLSRFVSVNAAPAPTPAVPPRPRGDLTRASIEEIAQAVRTTWPTKSADNRWRRSRGARDLLEHLSEFPGQTWQDRWLASGFNEPGRPVSVLRSAPRDRSQIGTGAACLFCLRVIQSSLEAFRSNQFLYYGKRFLVAQNDPLLDKFWEQVQATPVNPVHHGTALFDVAVALTTQGIALADLTPAAFLHYAWECRRQGAGSRRPRRGQPVPGASGLAGATRDGALPAARAGDAEGRVADRPVDRPGDGRPLSDPPCRSPAVADHVFGAPSA